MEAVLDRVRAWNRRLMDLPRKGVLVAATCVTAWVLWRLLPLVWPFLIGYLASRLIEPVVRLLTRRVGRFHLPRVLAALLMVALLYGLVALAGWALIARLVSELAAATRAAPDIIRPVLARAGELATQALGQAEPITDLINSLLGEAGKLLVSGATKLSTYLASGAVTTVASLPCGLLAVVLTVMATFYFSYDRARISAFIRRNLPEHAHGRLNRLRRGMAQAIGKQVRAQLLVSLAITGIVALGLVVLRKPHGLVVGLMIGLADALPVVGAGLFLLPWSLAGFLLGDTATGIGMAVLYLLTVAARQVLEPRIVGRSLGQYPLATMMSMYAGYRLLGFAGLLVGPVLLSLCRLVLLKEEPGAA